MDPNQIRRRAPVLWLFLGLLVILVCVLAILQYRWIGEISANEQKNRKADLQTAANKLSSTFNAELSAAAEALQPSGPQVQAMGRQKAYETRYREWRASSPHPRLFRRAALVAQENDRLMLRMFNTETGVLELAQWPADWIAERDFIAGRMAGNTTGPLRIDNPALIDYPRYGAPPDPGAARAAEQDWLLLEVDSKYAGGVILPELMAQHLREDFRVQYRVEVISRADPSQVIFGTDSGPAVASAGSPQAAVTLFEVPRAARGRGATTPVRVVLSDSGRGRWLLSVWLRSGSLDHVVASARRRNLAVSGAILILLLATGAALVQFSRRAQRLAQVEMEFVTGVSHELRTPLTVIRTAAFNLRGKVASNPSQVERYGALIQRESERLGEIVEQVLRFAGAQAGRVVQERQPISVAGLIEETLQSNKSMLEDALCEVETRIEPGMPPITGDSLALRHALQNLLANAAKYGAAGEQAIGISARTVRGVKSSEIEIRVADHGSGIPPEEQMHVFDAFFRGRKAVQDQVHGTGLGLHLVKKIVEAHGGTVGLESEPGAGSTFIVRLPVAPAEHKDELAPSLS